MRILLLETTQKERKTQKMYCLNEEKMFYDVAEGLAVVINLTTGNYFGFNHFGTAVIDSLLSGADEVEIAKDLKERDGCPDDIEERIRNFAEALLKKEILLKTDGDAVKAEIADDLVEDGYEPKFEEFSDIQDLIMADPIHEIDLEKEWLELK